MALLIVIATLVAEPLQQAFRDPAFIEAAHQGDIDAMEQMIGSGIDLNQTDRHRATAMHAAVKAGHDQVVKLLMEVGADVDVRDVYGWTPFLIAASEGNVEVMKMLETQGAKVDAVDNDNANALIWACANGHRAAVAYLLQKGFDLNHRDKLGRVAFDFVRFSDDKVLIKQLRDAGATVQEKPIIELKHEIVVKHAPILDFEGKRFQLEDYRGKVLLIDFWATWCQPCHFAIPTMKYLDSKMSEEHFELVGIAVDKESTVVKEFVESEGMNWMHFVDTKGASLMQFGVKSFPTYALFDPNGEMIFAMRGWSEENDRKLRSQVNRAVRAAKKASKRKN